MELCTKQMCLAVFLFRTMYYNAPHMPIMLCIFIYSLRVCESLPSRMSDGMRIEKFVVLVDSFDILSNLQDSDAQDNWDGKKLALLIMSEFFNYRITSLSMIPLTDMTLTLFILFLHYQYSTESTVDLIFDNYIWKLLIKKTCNRNHGL